ncbi:MAG TPA: glycosyltransferase [Bryobacteraceae bacterium]|nr:glycosyltransferase [Bryobacteraceae bacterium]
MKVLHVGKYYPPYMGGIETHLQALSRELTKTLDLRVIVSNDRRGSTREVLDGVNLVRISTPLKLFSTPLSPAMVSAIRDSTADLIHIHLPNPTAIMAYLASGHRGKAIFTYHSDTVKHKVLGSLFQPLLDAALRRSSAVIATSPNYLATSPVLATVRDRCHVIPYGIDLEQFERVDAAEVARVRQQYGERLIVSVGRLVYYKGFEYLIRAMARVNGKLLIIGGGPLRADLLKLASELGIAERVVLVGEVQNERVIPYYHAAQIFALASVARSEAFGIVQIEAMAAGLPVVNTALDSGVPFVSLDGQTGLTVAPADSDAMATALNRLLDDAELRRTLGSAGIRRARQEFSLETMVGRTLQLYRSILKADSGMTR